MDLPISSARESLKRSVDALHDFDEDDNRAKRGSHVVVFVFPVDDAYMDAYRAAMKDRPGLSCWLWIQKESGWLKNYRTRPRAGNRIVLVNTTTRRIEAVTTAEQHAQIFIPDDPRDPMEYFAHVREYDAVIRVESMSEQLSGKSKDLALLRSRLRGTHLTKGRAVRLPDDFDWHEFERSLVNSS